MHMQRLGHLHSQRCSAAPEELLGGFLNPASKWVTDWGLLFWQSLIIEKRTHFKLEGTTKTQLLKQDGKVELTVLALQELFSSSHKQFIISEKDSISIRKKKHPFPANRAQGLGFSNLTGWDINALLRVWPRFSFLCTHTQVCNDSAPQCWALTDPEDEHRDPDPKTSHAYCQSHLCVSQENYCVTLDLAMRFSLPPHLPNWLL